MSGSQCYIGAPNGVIICVDNNDAHILRGRLYHSYTKEALSFENAGQMSFIMEELYDSLNFPHPGTNKRLFAAENKTINRLTERDKIMTDDELLSKHGDIGTFIVRVQHRQNSSWQGRITWMEQDSTLYFRSIWEMIKLIENAVDTVSHQESGDEDTPVWPIEKPAEDK